MSVGHGDSLVDSVPFVRRVAGSNPDLAATSPSLASCLWCFGMQLRQSICAVLGAHLSSS